LPSEILSKATAAAIAAAHAVEEKHQHQKAHSDVTMQTTNSNNVPPSLNSQKMCCSSRYLSMNMGAGKDVDVVIGHGLLVPISPRIPANSESFGSADVRDF